jgi:membrane-associated phospholipid phosphatase
MDRTTADDQRRATAAAPAQTRRGWRIRAALAVVVVVLLVFLAFLMDGPIERLVPGNPDPRWQAAALFVTTYANLPFLLLAAAALLALGFWRRNRFWMTLAVALVLSSCLAGAVATGVRATTGRTRPTAREPQGWYGIRHDSQWLIGRYDFNSFPSGHTATAMGFAGVLLLGVRRWHVPAVLLGVLMGWSRVFLGCHHFSDVFVSALIGLAVGYLTWHRLIPVLARRWPHLLQVPTC